MNEFCAAMGICNLRHLEEEIEKRRLVVEAYRKRLENVPGIQLNAIQKQVKSNYAYFPIVVDEKVFGQSRDDIFERLASHNIIARKYFYPLTNEFECYKDIFNPEETPVADYVSKHVLTLPLYSDLSIEEVNLICDIILNK